MNNNSIILSVIVPCFNSGIFLRECIDSIVSSKINSCVEVIIVDDGSTDNITIHTLEKCMSLDNIVVERLQCNHGVQYARNIGIAKSNGKFLMTLDSDDKLNNNIDGGYSGMTISSYPLNEDLILSKHHVPTSIIYRKSDLVTGDNYLIGVKKWQDWAFGVKLLANRWTKNLTNKIYSITKPHHQYRVHSKWLRISYSNINEYEMTLMTIMDSILYFQYFWGMESAEEIAKTVISMKPSKIDELCRIANHDVGLARKIIRERKFRLVSSNVGNKIP